MANVQGYVSQNQKTNVIADDDKKQYKVIQQLEVKGGKLVFFDLETTGLEADCDIVQISAWCGNKTMMLHVMPTKRIHPQASKVNNIVVRDGKMYHSGELVDALDRHSALCEFAKFLTDLGPALVLVAHNGARFDFPRLIRQMNVAEVTLPHNVVHFLDSRSLLKSLYPDRKSYHLVDVVADLLDASYGAHDASEDSRILQDLVGLAMKDADPVTLRTVVERHLLSRANVLRSVPGSVDRSVEEKLENLRL